MATYYLPDANGWSDQQLFGANAKLRLKVVTSYDRAANRSTLTISLQSWCSAASGRFYLLNNGRLTARGSTLYDGGGDGSRQTDLYVSYQGDSSWRDVIDLNNGSVKTWTTTATHAADGSASVAIGGKFRFWWSSQTFTTFYDLSATLQLQETRTYTLTITNGAHASATVKRGGTTLANGATLTQGDVLTISFAASTGYMLSTHTVNGASFTSGGTHTVTGDVSVAVTATEAKYNLTLQAGTGASITVKRGGTTLTNGATLTHGDQLTVSFGANTGYALSTHTVNGASFTSGGTHTVTGPVTVAATAVKKTYTLTISQGTGSTVTVKRNGTTLSNGATLTHGDVLTVSFGANTGYAVSTHTVNGAAFTSGEGLTVTGAVSVVATAVKKTYTLTISQGTGASVTVKRGGTTLSSGASVTHGDQLTVSFAASAGYALSTHTVNGVSFPSGGTHTVTGAVSVAATAARQPSTIASMSASAATQGTISLTVNRAGANYHKATVTANGKTLATSVTFVASTTISVARSWFTDYPSATSFTATVSVQSYTTSACTTKVGAAATRRLTITADGGMKPVLQSGYITAAPYNTGAVSGLTVYVGGYSRATVTLSAAKLDMSAAPGASVASVKVTGGGVTATAAPYRTGVLNGKQTVTVTVTDTRGRSAKQSVTIEPLAYAPPKISGVTAFRCTSGGTKSEDGAYFSVKATLSYSDLDGQNSATLKANGVTLTSGTARVIPAGADPDTAIDIELVARDRLGDATQTRSTRSLPGRRWALRFRPTGQGAAFGMSPTEDAALELPEDWVLKAGKWRGDANDNLLTNWDWRAPINQRGIETQTATELTMAVDRCEQINGTLTVNADSIGWSSNKAAAYKRVQLICDAPLYVGVTYTLTLFAKITQLSGRIRLRMIDGTKTQLISQVVAADGVYTPYSVSFTPAEPVDDPIAELLCWNTAEDYITAEIKAWKLELGRAQTLARRVNGVWELTAQADAAREREKCLRYLQIIEGETNIDLPISFSRTTTAAGLVLPLPVTMAATPRLEVNDPSKLVLTKGAMATGAVCTDVVLANTNRAYAALTLTTSGLTAASAYRTILQAGGKLILSAENG